MTARRITIVISQKMLFNDGLSCNCHYLAPKNELIHINATMFFATMGFYQMLLYIVIIKLLCTSGISLM